MDAETLRSRKNNLGITVAELAVRADLPVGTVSKIMTGETKRPTVVTIEKIDKALCEIECRLRLEAYLTALKDYMLSHPEARKNPATFEPVYRKIHDLDERPIEWADSKSDARPIWDNLVRKNNDTVTVSEFLAASSGQRNIELFDGTVIVNEAPGFDHQMMIKTINKQIDKYIDANGGDCMVFDMGMGVRLDEKDNTYLIPDIVVLCDRKKIKPFGILGTPDMVIEILSPGTRHYDFKKKSYKYLAAGVRELWLVDLEKERVVVYTNDECLLSHIYGFEDEIPVNIYDGDLRISLK